MTIDIDSTCAGKALNHCFLIAGRDKIFRCELLAAQLYVSGLAKSKEEPNYDKICVLVDLLDFGARALRNARGRLLAVEVEQALANAKAVRDYLLSEEYGDAA